MSDYDVVQRYIEARNRATLARLSREGLVERITREYPEILAAEAAEHVASQDRDALWNELAGMHVDRYKSVSVEARGGRVTWPAPYEKWSIEKTAKEIGQSACLDLRNAITARLTGIGQGDVDAIISCVLDWLNPSHTLVRAAPKFTEAER